MTTTLPASTIDALSTNGVLHILSLRSLRALGCVNHALAIASRQAQADPVLLQLAELCSTSDQINPAMRQRAFAALNRVRLVSDPYYHDITTPLVPPGLSTGTGDQVCEAHAALAYMIGGSLRAVAPGSSADARDDAAPGDAREVGCRACGVDGIDLGLPPRSISHTRRSRGGGSTTSSAPGKGGPLLTSRLVLQRVGAARTSIVRIDDAGVRCEWTLERPHVRALPEEVRVIVLAQIGGDDDDDDEVVEAAPWPRTAWPRNAPFGPHARVLAFSTLVCAAAHGNRG